MTAAPLSSLDAVVLAGGLGTRLRDAIGETPKPLAAIQGRPFLDILTEELLRQGLRRIILCVGHRREQIVAHFSGRHDAQFVFSEETTPLGTGGALRRAAPLIASDPFLALNGDSFCRVDYARFLAFHRAKSATASLVLAPPAGRADGGNVELAADGKITAFREKTGGGTLINAGIYLMARALPGSWTLPDPFSLERDIFPQLAAAGGCYGHRVEAEVLDIGTPQRYAEAQHKL